MLVPRLPAPAEIRRTIVSKGSSVLLGQGVDETLDQRLRIRQVHPDGALLSKGSNGFGLPKTSVPRPHPHTATATHAHHTTDRARNHH